MIGFVGGLIIGLIFGVAFERQENDYKNQELERIIHKQSKQITRLKLIINSSYGVPMRINNQFNQDLTKI